MSKPNKISEKLYLSAISITKQQFNSIREGALNYQVM